MLPAVLFEREFLLSCLPDLFVTYVSDEPNETKPPHYVIVPPRTYLLVKPLVQRLRHNVSPRPSVEL